MELTFHSLDELQAFTAWVSGGRTSSPETVTLSVTQAECDALANAIKAGLAEDDEKRPQVLDERQPEGEMQSAGEPAKRKRRTKAEMEAAKAAEAGAPETTEVTPAGTVAQVAPENKGNPFAQQTLPEGAEATGAPPKSEPAAAADKGDYAEFLAARLAERPTMEQIEHMKYARNFIGKFDLTTYNTAFEMAGLSPNVMGYTPEDCARHAATLDYLSL